ncbi:MAG: hypothetical protein GWM89_09720, partial [Candidatus Dadabacteria bacterium]|nr:hypothetical protein [Candidatus Dadabacteria bacterium]NIY22679.1 hypothetical protein [Candidatus Dadabacteria bacterium]
FEIFTNTGPLSQLDDDNDTDDPDMTVPVETVCSTSNVANQAFASFEADAGILGPDTAVVQCCIDQSGMDPADGCDPIDPQGNTAINVDPPPPSIITISAPAGLTPMDGDTRAIDVATNLPVPAGTQICLFMQDQDGVFPELNNTAGGDMTTAEEPFPTTNAANTICLNTIDDSGQLLGEFELDFSVVGVNADVGDTVTVVGCIDSSNGGLCGLGEPLSNALVFTIVGP